MGKAVILVFFVLAFVVFAFIKAAATGVKKAYHAVNDTDNLKPMPKLGKMDLPDEPWKQKPREEPKDKSLAITKLINNSLDVQLSLSGHEPGRLPDDDFVIGYLVGYADAITQANDIDNNSAEGFAIATIPFLHQFGKDRGAEIFGRFLDQQSNLPSKMKDGLMAGGQDMMDYLKSGGDKAPMRLTGYFLDT